MKKALTHRCPNCEWQQTLMLEDVERGHTCALRSLPALPLAWPSEASSGQGRTMLTGSHKTTGREQHIDRLDSAGYEQVLPFLQPIHILKCQKQVE